MEFEKGTFQMNIFAPQEMFFFMASVSAWGIPFYATLGLNVVYP